MGDQWLEIGAGIAAWYVTSFGTLMLNKYLLGSLQVPPNTLAVVQMVSTAIYGALKTVSFQELARLARQAWSENFASQADGMDLENGDAPDKSRMGRRWRRGLIQMGLVGMMRFATVVLGLVSLKHVAASFTETIKASAPFFTVIIAYLMLGETTTPKVLLSLVPVACGLALVSTTELSFNIIGFTAAVATNIIECVQNVFSKRLLAREYTASQLQFYTSLTALLLQAPIWVLSAASGASVVPAGRPAPVFHPALQNASLSADIDSASVPEVFSEPVVVLTWNTLALLWVDGVLYHLQSVVAYVVMSYLSPVTVSVVNTVKRALLIVISVLIFGNPVTLMTKLGTLICLGGVLFYNVARQSASAAPKGSSSAPPQKV